MFEALSKNFWKLQFVFGLSGVFLSLEKYLYSVFCASSASYITFKRTPVFHLTFKRMGFLYGR